MDQVGVRFKVLRVTESLREGHKRLCEEGAKVDLHWIFILCSYCTYVVEASSRELARLTPTSDVGDLESTT
jgi:hypothetical protein